MIIGICGLIGSGKGTVADMLQQAHGFQKISFADNLKDMVASVFGWPRHLLEGDTTESREWREKPDAWWSEQLGKPITPRWILQYWGTEVCRHGFHNDIWVLSLQRKIANEPGFDYVIPDTRFPNEVDAIRRLGGQIWRVKRGDEPAWFTEYQDSGNPKTVPTQIHPSEYMWATSKFDETISNDGTLQELRTKVDSIIAKSK